MRGCLVVLQMATIAASSIGLVHAIEPEVMGVVAEDTKSATVPAGPEERVAAEIARLDDSSESDRVDAVKALITMGKPAAPVLVMALGDPRNDVRRLAAEALRSILAADPTSAPNCHTKAHWNRRIAQLKPGMTLDEALTLLLPELSPAERRRRSEGSAGSGDSGFSIYRLDDYWAVRLDYLASGRKLRDLVPDLFRSVRRVWVKPPTGCTGVWATWFVNGQKAAEIQYRNGQYDGTFTSFYHDGGKCYQQHYTKGVCHGDDTGWHRNGRKSYEGRYEHGKQTGTWQHWDESGQIVSTIEYRAGIRVESTGE